MVIHLTRWRFIIRWTLNVCVLHFVHGRTNYPYAITTQRHLRKYSAQVSIIFTRNSRLIFVLCTPNAKFPIHKCWPAIENDLLIWISNYCAYLFTEPINNFSFLPNNTSNFLLNKREQKEYSKLVNGILKLILKQCVQQTATRHCNNICYWVWCAFRHVNR